MNEPPDQTAEFNAANLLSVGGMMVLKYSRTDPGTRGAPNPCR